MKMDYQKLLFDGKNWAQPSIDLIKNMLEVWDNNHKIIVCHPNLVFNQKVVSIEEPDFDEIDFENTRDNLNIIHDNSYTNIYPDPCKTWKYIYQRLYHEVFAKKINEPRHLAIVEFDQNNKVLVRGIFKATKKDLFVSVNPLYENYRPKSIEEKKERLINGYISFDEYINKQKVKTRSINI